MTPSPVILALAPNEWAGPWMNRQQLLSRLGTHYPILYSTGLPRPGHTKGPGRGGLRGQFRRQDHVLLDCPPTWSMRPARPGVLQNLADALAVRRWRKSAGIVGGGPLIAYVFHPKFWPVAKRLRPHRLVYHAYDLYHLQAPSPDTFAEEERELVTRADLVIASSITIADHLRSIGAPRVELLENAADYDHFAQPDGTPDPADMASIPRPRVGYAGALNRKVDFPLFSRLAARLPDVHFIFVGQVGRLDAECQRALDDLQARDNVHFLGFKAPAELPPYMAAMDVNVMAYRIGDDVWTAGIYPLKMHEYLAVGQPVVTADLPSVRPFADVIRIAVSPEDWEKALTEGFADKSTGTRDRRRARARQNSWNARADRLHALLRALLAHEKTAAVADTATGG